MAQREVIILDESGPTLDVPQLGDTYLFPRSIAIVDGTEAAGYVLTSDAFGNASWQAVGASLSGATTVDNSLYGVNAGASLTTGVDNTLIGVNVGQNITTGSNNVGVGDQALLNCPTYLTGDIAIGRSALANDTSGNQVAIGDIALSTLTTGSANVAIGYRAVRLATSSHSNIAIGTQVAEQFTTAYQNVALGREAMNLFTTGFSNTAVGYRAMYGTFPSQGDQNVAVGDSALFKMQNGNQNVGVGMTALYSTVNGLRNVALGYQAGYFTIGNDNTYIGNQAGRQNSTGAGNVFLGYNAGYSETGSNKLYIANTSTATPLIYGDFALSEVEFNGTVFPHSSSAIRAHKNGVNQTAIASGSTTLVTFGTESFDPKGFWTAGTSRFQPTQAGTYRIYSLLRYTSMAAGVKLTASIFKNGVLEVEGPMIRPYDASSISCYVDGLVVMNGTTDYVEIYTYQQSGSNKIIDGTAEKTFVSANIVL